MQLEFKRLEDHEGDNNRGWQVDTLVAFVGGEEAGYIKASYIPRDRFDKYYPHIWAYLSQISGWCLFEFGKVPPTELTIDDKLNCIQRTGGQTGRSDWLNISYLKRPSDEAIERIYPLALERVEKIYRKDFDEFQSYWTNNPVVDYIRVYNESDFKSMTDKKRKNLKNWRGKGLGNCLYVEMTKWMNEKGMNLYASSLQTDEAKKVWTKMGKIYKVRKKKFIQRDKPVWRRYLDLSDLI